MMPMYNLIVYNNNFLKTWGYICQYYRNDPLLINNVNIVNFPGNNVLLEFKQILTGKTPSNGNAKDFEIAVT